MLKAVRLGILLGLLASWSPVNAIVIANSSYNADVSYGDIVDGINFGGVVEINSVIGGNTYGCSGSLLTDGYSILTAGHCVTQGGAQATPSSITVSFLAPGGGMQVVTVSNVQIDPAYTPGSSQLGSDLAVLTLSQQAPSYAVEYQLFSGSPVLDTPLVIAGYGLSGTGTTGADGPFGALQVGENEYEGNGSEFFGYSSQLLVGEFYESGDPSTNALGCHPKYFNGCTTATPYTGEDEVDISPGDSGGPTFYDDDGVEEIIGVHDLGICASNEANGPCLDPPSINSANNSYFGEAFADTSVADNLTFIEDAEVPEPGTLGMLGFGFTALIAFAHRRLRGRPSSSLTPQE
jgi:hypothetical protein